MSSNSAVYLRPARVHDANDGHSLFKWSLLGAGSLGYWILSIWFLSGRNIYEDELSSFLLVPRGWLSIWRMANATDVHPAGMYLLSHLFYTFIPSERWLVLGSLLTLFIGLVVYAAACLPHFTSQPPAAIAFTALVFLHPQLLLWANSMRWYPSWTGLALIVLTIGLKLYEDEPGEILSLRSALVVALLCGLMMYISYFTLLFVPAFAIACLIRFRFQPRLLIRLLIAGTVFAILSAPQWFYFIKVHLPNSASQDSSFVVALLRIAHGVFISEAMMPWHLAGLMFLCLVILPIMVVVARRVPLGASSMIRGNQGNTTLALGACFLLLYAAGVVTGTGAKPRSLLILCPVFAFLLAWGLREIRFLGIVVIQLAVIAIWITMGADHLLSKTGTAKWEINDRVSDVVQLVDQQAAGRCLIVFTYDPDVTYALNEQAKLTHERWTVCSAFADYVHHVEVARAPRYCRPEISAVIQSYPGALHEYSRALTQALDQANLSLDKTSVAYLSKDPDFSIKRRLPVFKTVTQNQSPYRFIVTFGRPRPDVEWSRLAQRFAFYRPPEWSGLSDADILAPATAGLSSLTVRRSAP
jgi:hypothetical protein